jgi:phosphate transport system substrate-binding protein
MRHSRLIALLILFLILPVSADAQSQPMARITIDGSTGVMPLAAALAKAFQERIPGISIELGSGLGTKARIQALDEGRIDIALASHGLDQEEVRRRGMSVHGIARTAVVFGVNSSVPLSNLTDQQICEVYSGKTASWQALGGPAIPIAPRTRPDSEVDAEVIRGGIACLKALRLPETVKVMPRSGDMAKELADTAGAIGMTSLTVVEQSSGRIRALSFNGVAPTPGNVESKAYPLVREAFFVTKTPTKEAVGRFIAFVVGPEGEKVIRANGALPLR